MKRPFGDRRPVGPFINLESGDDGDEIEFNSIDDLPDSPMLEQYVERVSNYLDASEEEIINARATKEYMKELGVWKLAVQKNR